MWKKWKLRKVPNNLRNSVFKCILITCNLQKGKIFFLLLKSLFCCLMNISFTSQLPDFQISGTMCPTSFCMWNTDFVYYKMKMGLIYESNPGDYIAQRNSRKNPNKNLDSFVTFEKEYVQHASLSGYRVMACLKSLGYSVQSLPPLKTRQKKNYFSKWN